MHRSVLGGHQWDLLIRSCRSVSYTIPVILKNRCRGPDCIGNTMQESFWPTAWRTRRPGKGNGKHG